VVPLPDGFLAEADRIKNSRVAPAQAPKGHASRGAHGGEERERNRVKRPKSRRPNFGPKGAPKSNRARRRASGR